MYSVGILSTKLNNASSNDIQLAKRVLRYIKQTRNYSMIYYKHPFSTDLSGYSDANFGVENRGLSRSGTISMMFNNPINWVSKLQTVPALSTCESEWYAVDLLHRDLLWIKQYLLDLGNQSTPFQSFVTIYQQLEYYKMNFQPLTPDM